MKKLILSVFGLTCLLSIIPQWSWAQDHSTTTGGLHLILDQLYQQMMPLCSQLIGVAQSIAGFAALWYIGSRVWRHLANAEPIDFYPLLRPFVLGFAIMIFPEVMNLINGILQPTVDATAAMVTDSDQAVARLLKAKAYSVKHSTAYQLYVGSDGAGNRDQWYQYTYDQDPTQEGLLQGIGNDLRFEMDKLSYRFRNTIKEWMSEVLQVIFEAASLCINTLRTFNLIVLTILGPFVFGIAVFDGFQHTLTSWLSRYMNTFLWLPVANIFGSIIGKVQEQMLQLDLQQIAQNGDTFFSTTDTAYLVFMVIAIIGYFTVPSVASYIVHAGGSGGMVQKVTHIFSSTLQKSSSIAQSNASRMTQGISHLSGSGPTAHGGPQGGSSHPNQTGGASGQSGSYLHSKLSS